MSRAEDELNISIDRAAWPVGAMHSLTSQLRALGDTHGNLVIIASPAKGSIMIKGPMQQIVGAKRDLRQLVEEYFPDADMPVELGGGPSLATGKKTVDGIEDQDTLALLSQQSAGITEAIPGQVKLFWKLAVPDLGLLPDMGPSGSESQLDMVLEPHVTLLFFGGRDNEKAAKKADLPLSRFCWMNDELEARAGQTVCLVADAIYTHPDIVFATVSLPPDLPCHGTKPYVKFLFRPGIPGDFARSLLQSPDAAQWRHDLPQPIQLRGIVSLEMGMPLPSTKTKTVRPQRLAEEAQGRWVHVKKHNSMGWAVVTFPSQAVCNNVLSWYSQKRVPLKSIVLDVRPHQEKQPNGTKDVPEALFVAWKQRGKSALHPGLISQNDLVQSFDQATAPWMTQSASLEKSAQVANTLLRSKGSSSPGNIASGMDDIILLRLARKARSPEVAAQLLGSPFLANCRAHVIAAGCEVEPAWANGAKLLTPITHQQVLQAGLELEHYHIIACQCDVADINHALAVIPCRQRPKLAHERHPDLGNFPTDAECFFVVECTLRTNSSYGPLSY